MFENLNRYSEILILTAIMILPFCHFLDKEGYQFTWSWYVSKCWIITFLSIVIESIEVVCSTIQAFQYKPLNENTTMFDENPNQEFITSQKVWKNYYFLIFTKGYNMLMIYLIYKLLRSITENDFSYSNYIFDQLFVISIFLFMMKISMLHKNNQTDKNLLKSLKNDFLGSLII